MKLPIKVLLGLGALAGTAAAAIAVDRRRRQLTGRGAGAPRDLGVGEMVIVDAEIVGIADVDPELLTQMGEAVDPDAVRRAHEEIPEQRAKLRKP